MGLYLSAGFFCGMECPIKNCKIVLADVTLSIRAVRRQHGSNLIEIFRVHGFTVEIAFSELDAHGFVTLGFLAVNAGSLVSTSRAPRTFPSTQACALPVRQL